MEMRIGDLDAVPALGRPDLLAPAVAEALAGLNGLAGQVGVAEIDPELADTAAFCERYGVGLAESADCVLISGKRGGETRFAACMVLATTRADVNGVVRRELDVRKASFASRDVAVAETGMEYGGITPVGLPATWPVLVDAAVVAPPQVVIGSGVRRSKLVLPGAALGRLPAARVIASLASPGLSVLGRGQRPGQGVRARSRGYRSVRAARTRGRAARRSRRTRRCQ
jgi:prolyl-tRNA editing enzyme YbaK/EbsC (Cys-tRNA(Pro) deacylase)